MADGALAVEVDGRTLHLTSLDKVLYPATETTKAEVLEYYAQIAPVLLPQLRNRPVTRVRWPHGVAADSFFEKNLPSGAPQWLGRTTLGAVTYPLVGDLAALTYLANLNALEFHIPQWQVGAYSERLPPDRLVIDLDPGPGADEHECAQVALLVQERLAGLGMDLWPVTSGSKGMQLYARLGGDLSSDQVRELAQTLAQELTKARPELVVWKMTTALRPGKVLLDWGQNNAHKTTIAPYSLRGRSRPWVAAPRTWEEVAAGAQRRATLTQLDLQQALSRVRQVGDLLAGLS